MNEEPQSSQLSEPVSQLPAAPPDTATVPAAEPSTFDEMGLRPEVLRAITEMGFVDPMPVQSATFRRVMAGEDLMIQSRTGSGKTAAFGIPFAQGLLDTKDMSVQALALCPTRELALQVGNECTRIGAHVGMRVVAIYGGAPMGRQIEALKEGVQMVAGTPGRVLDHLRRGTLKLDQLRILVLDEADEMLSMGFYEEISEILKRCPAARQTMLFSATFPDEIERIGTRHMRSPQKISLSEGYISVREITHAYYLVSGMGRSRDLVRILAIEKPESAIIFCNTREETSLVAEYLRREGMDAEAISSDLTQNDRERVMGRMKEGNLHYLVATDIAARGIDISDLSHVINYTFPESAEVYVHRTGRTGRAGKKGIAISLVSPRELGNFYYLKLTYKIRPDERMLPSDEEEATRRDGERTERLAADLGGHGMNPGEEWRRLARRLWAAEGGEALVAALVERHFKQPFAPSITAPRVAPVAVEGSASVEEAASAREPTERPPRSEPRARRDRNDRGGRSSREGAGGRGGRRSSEERGAGRSERGARNDRGGLSEHSAPRAAVSAPPARVEAAAAPSETPPDPPPPTDATAAIHAEAPTDRPKRERQRRRRGERPSERPAPSPTSARAPTLSLDDGREFWEVWADDRTEPDATTLARIAVSPEPTDPTAKQQIPPGATRLYLGLGRRDGLKPDEIERWVRDHGVSFRDAQVHSSHTYLIVDDAQADAAVATLDKQRHGERELVCERARR